MKTNVLQVPDRLAARSVGLHYTLDSKKGITRRRKGDEFFYEDSSGRKIRDSQKLLRIRRLVLPPAWKDVWICPAKKGTYKRLDVMHEVENSIGITPTGAHFEIGRSTITF